MNNTYLLITALIILLFLSSFFSGSETAMMALNRYRLRHLVREGHPGAKRAAHLLERPDRLLGMILIGNTFANLLASSIATLLALQFFGEVGAIVTTICLALFVLIFSEITPKTIAVLYPERLAFATSGPLSVLLKIMYPLVWVSTMVCNGLLRILNIKVEKHKADELTGEEVRTIVYESTSQLAMGYKNMMLGVLDLGGVTVNDIKVPRSDIVGIDIDRSWDEILKQLRAAEHTRLPIYRESIDDVIGLLHMRKVLNTRIEETLNKERLLEIAEEVYFVPDSTPLNVQLINFRQEKKRIGLVVDEYGDIQGLVTLDDILEEIVGEFTTNLPDKYKNITHEKSGCYIVDGGINVRELNRRMQWQLPLSGPITLSGMIVEYLEMIPELPMCLILEGYRMEILDIQEKMIKKVRIWPILSHENAFT